MKTTIQYLGLGAALLAGLCHCSTTPSELIPQRSNSTKQSLVSSEGPRGLSGYSHLASASKLRIGTEMINGTTRQEGPLGVFSVVPETGFSTGTTNGDAAVRRRPPIADAEEHNAFVREYFIGSGLPVEQVERVGVQAAISGGGREGDERVMQNHTLDYYYSTLFRKTSSGIRIPDSFAWARVNVDRDIVAESVFWPPIDGELVETADRLKAVLDSPEARARFVANIPEQYSTREKEAVVLIRHTHGVGVGAEVKSRAVISVPYRNTAVEFDEGGTIVVPPPLPIAEGSARSPK